MIIERHYDEESIISFLEGSDASASRDPHLSSCTICASTLASFRSVSSSLKEESVWEPRELREQPVPQTLAFLRNYAANAANEDAQAEDLVRELLTGPREWWHNKLRHEPRYFTAGVVRKLIAATDRAIDTMPADAVEITALAGAIADALDPARYPSQTVVKLRAAAWRERAYALFFVGQFADAVAACDKADGYLAQCMIVDYDKARLDLVRALTYRQMDRVDEALALTKPTAAVFERFGDRARVRTARSVEALLLMKVGNYVRALDVLLSLERELGRDADPESLAMLVHNIGCCYRALGDYERTIEYSTAAATMFDDLRFPVGAVRVRWNIARALMSLGRHDEALRQLTALQKDFQSLSMMMEAAVAGLDLAEVLAMQNRHGEVEVVCRAAMRYFESAGVPYIERALTAIGYLQEASKAGRATPRLVQHVRTFIDRLPVERELLFAPPPLD